MQTQKVSMLMQSQLTLTPAKADADKSPSIAVKLCRRCKAKDADAR
jgi:hypothetical protein